MAWQGEPEKWVKSPYLWGFLMAVLFVSCMFLFEPPPCQEGEERIITVHRRYRGALVELDCRVKDAEHGSR